VGQKRRKICTGGGVGRREKRKEKKGLLFSRLAKIQTNKPILSFLFPRKERTKNIHVLEILSNPYKKCFAGAGRGGVHPGNPFAPPVNTKAKRSSKRCGFLAHACEQ
jgi:hypothetical protein